MAPMFWLKGVQFARAISTDLEQAADNELDIMSYISRVTLDIIGAAGLGTDFRTIMLEENELANLYGTITSPNRGPIVLFFAINILFPPWIIRKMYGTVYARVAKAAQELRIRIRSLLAEKQRTLKQNDIEETNIIAMIMRSGTFTDDYLCDQILTFFAAGHDTISAALAWTSRLLALHPQVQTRLRKECIQHIQSVDEIDADVLDNMPLLTAVCNESLRLYPPISLTARTAVVDTRIGKQHVPKGTHIVIAPWVINQDTKMWGQTASKFDPDRWLQGPLAASGGATSPYAFQTFLYGPRSCIGQHFAKLELKCLLVALIMRFELTPPADHEDAEIGGVITMKPKCGLKLKLRDLGPQVEYSDSET